MFFLVLTVLFPALAALLLRLLKEKAASHRTVCAVTGLSLLAECAFCLIACTGEDAAWTFLSIGADLPLVLSLDPLSRFFAPFFTLMWTVPVLYSFHYMESEGHERRYYVFYLLTLSALNALAFSGTLVTLYLFFELMTLLSVALVLHEMTREAIAAGIKYLLYSIAGATMGLLGIFFLAANTSSPLFTAGGSLRQDALTVSPQALLVILFITLLGFGTKAGLFPMHAWLPTAHPIAPAPASAVLSGVITKAGVLCILRILYYVVGPDFLRGTWAQYALCGVALATVFMGSMMAFKTDLFKKRLAYSTVSQVSYVLLGVFLLHPTALTGSMMHIVFHSAIKTCLFLAAGGIIHQTGKTKVSQLEGIGKQMPVTLWCFTLASVGLIGIPPTGGFISKWNLAQGALDSGLQVIPYLAPAVLLLSALLTAGYLLDVTIHGFFPGRDFDYASLKKTECPALMLVPMILCVLFTFLGGMFPSPLQSFFEGIVRGLF